MNSRRGFTLVELLGAIVILAILSLIAIPVVTNSVKKNKEKLYDIQIKNVESAAKAWGSDNLNLLPDEGEYITISLSELQKNGYVDKDIKNPKTGEALEDFNITICNIDNQYTYKKDGDCEVPIESDATLTSLKVNGEELLTKEDYTIVLNSGITSIEITAKAKNEKAKINGTGTQTVNAGTNTFEVTVTSEDGKKQKKYSIKVIVDKSVAEIPTASYCKTGLVYTGNTQTLTKEAGIGYTFSKNTGTNAGSHTVEAVLSNGYKWSDDTTGAKTISCSIDQATPTITLSSESGTVTYGTSSKTFTVETSIDGIISLSDDNDTATESFIVDTSSSNKYNVTISNLGNISAGITVKVTVKFTPTDTTNYNSATKTYELTINKAKTATTGSCVNLTYNGSSQTLASGGNHVSYTNNTRTNAGNQTVTVNADSNYTFSDGTTSKTLSCSIKKATPTITLNTSSGEVEAGKEITFTEQSNVAGSFSNVSGTTSVATVTPSNYSDVTANTKKTATIAGVSDGTSTITVTFTPTDTTNYNTATTTYTVTTTPQKSSDATLLDIKINGNSIENFSSSIYSYNLTLSPNTTSITVEAITNDQNASVLMYLQPSGEQFKSKTHEFEATNGQVYEIAIVVIAEDNQSTSYNQVNITVESIFSYTKNDDDSLTINGFVEGVDLSLYSDLFIPPNIFDFTVKSINKENSSSESDIGAFQNVPLNSLFISSTIETIGAYSFSGCGLTSVTFDENSNLNTIGDSAFSSNHLQNIDLPDSITNLGQIAFAGNELSNITIPSKISTLETAVFNSNNLEILSLPSNIQTINSAAFSYNVLNSISFTNNVESIYDSAFSSNNLTSITIPKSVKYLGSGAFANNKLSSIEFEDLYLPSTIGNGAFSNQNGNQQDPIPVYVSSDSTHDWASIFDGIITNSDTNICYIYGGASGQYKCSDCNSITPYSGTNNFQIIKGNMSNKCTWQSASS